MKFLNPLIGTELVEELIEKRLVPAQATRVIIDSGNPGDLVRVYSAGFGEADSIRALMDGPGKEYSDEICDLIQRSKLFRDQIEDDSEAYALLYDLERAILTLAKGMEA